MSAFTIVTVLHQSGPELPRLLRSIEAHAPRAAGAYRLTATVDPRDDVAELDEANNGADATVHVRG